MKPYTYDLQGYSIFFNTGYFLNADFHQDMTRGIKHCTFYIYLDDVEKKDDVEKIIENNKAIAELLNKLDINSKISVIKSLINSKSFRRIDYNSKILQF